MKVITKTRVPGKLKGSKVKNGRTFYLVQWTRFTTPYSSGTAESEWIAADKCKLEYEYPKWIQKIIRWWKKKVRPNKYTPNRNRRW